VARESHDPSHLRCLVRLWQALLEEAARVLEGERKRVPGFGWRAAAANCGSTITAPQPTGLKDSLDLIWVGDERNRIIGPLKMTAETGFGTVGDASGPIVSPREKAASAGTSGVLPFVVRQESVSLRGNRCTEVAFHIVGIDVVEIAVDALGLLLYKQRQTGDRALRSEEALTELFKCAAEIGRSHPHGALILRKRKVTTVPADYRSPPGHEDELPIVKGDAVGVRELTTDAVCETLKHGNALIG
jgi:hypothetical protein